MRNEYVEELIIESVSGSREEPNSETVKDGRVSGMESKIGRREEEARTSQEKKPRGSTRTSKFVREEGTNDGQNRVTLLPTRARQQGILGYRTV